jgi:uncharacterized membrane protein YphA (DoxX/SURF4 family)
MCRREQPFVTITIQNEAQGLVQMHIVLGDLQYFSCAHFAVSLAVFGIPPMIFWAYFAASVLFVIGMVKIFKTELPERHGLDKIMPFGRLFFAIPMAVFGTEHLTDASDIAGGVPQWLPAHTFWVYLVGIALLAAALSIVVKIQSRLAATLLGLTLCSFVLLIHIPNVVAQPGSRIFLALALRDTAFAGGAFAFAGCQMIPSRPGGVPWLVNLARFFIAIPAVFFGVEHFLHPTFAPGVPLGKEIPAWIPGRLFWAYLAGAVLVAAGACLILNIKARLAATSLGITILLLVLFVYLPLLVKSPSDIVAINYFFDTLVFSGAILLLADALGTNVRE